MTAIMPCEWLKWYAWQIRIAWGTIVCYHVTIKRYWFLARVCFYVMNSFENILASQNYLFKPSRCLYVHWLFVHCAFVCVCDGVGNRFDSAERRRWFESYEFRYIRHKANKCLFTENHFPWNDYGAYNNTLGRRCICNTHILWQSSHFHAQHIFFSPFSFPFPIY